MDCTSKDRDECELFLVEGDSAGGSADGGRDRFFQAILPLRGKILNVEKARLEKMLDNNEICSMISAIGTDIGESEDIDKRNYDKIIILTDADVDGSHIRTLLLTFLYRQMPNLIKEGHVFLAQPPLYRIIQRKTTRYVQTNEEMNRELMSRGLAGTKLTYHSPAGEAMVFEGERLRLLAEIMTPLEHALQILERRGLGLPVLLAHAQGMDLPPYRVIQAGQERWLFQPASQETTDGQQEVDAVVELHEVRAIERGLKKLDKLNLSPESLLPPKTIAGQEPAPRFLIENGDNRRPFHALRELLPEIRRIGEKGMNITRFKGLGEMNPDELWETTLDPAKRTLLRVTLEDAFKADEMFRILMGDKVEPRREFIEKHALEVRNLDV
jgi:DNA gyrase subunit B